MNTFNREATKNKSVFATRFTCLVIFALALFMFLCVVSSGNMFGGISTLIMKVLFGLFGLAVYPALIATLLSCLIIFVRKRSFINKKTAGILITLFFFAICIVHIATTSDWFANENLTYGKYLGDCYNLGGKDSETTTVTGGGVIMGLLLYYPVIGLQPVGMYIILSFAFLIGLIFLIRSIFVVKNESGMEQREYPIFQQGNNGPQTVVYNNGGYNPNMGNNQPVNGFYNNNAFNGNQNNQMPMQNMQNPDVMQGQQFAMNQGINQIPDNPQIQNVHHNYGTLNGSLFVDTIYNEEKNVNNQDTQVQTNQQIQDDRPLRTIVKPDVTYSEYFQSNLQENKKYPLKSKRYPIQEPINRPDDIDKKNSSLGDPYKPKNILDDIKEDPEYNKQIFRINLEESIKDGKSDHFSYQDSPKNVPILSGDKYAERIRYEKEHGVDFSTAKGYSYEKNNIVENTKKTIEEPLKTTDKQDKFKYTNDLDSIFVSSDDIEDATFNPEDIFKETTDNSIIDEEIAPIIEEDDEVENLMILEDEETEKEKEEKLNVIYSNKVEDFSNIKTSYSDDDAIMEEMDNKLNSSMENAKIKKEKVVKSSPIIDTTKKEKNKKEEKKDSDDINKVDAPFTKKLKPYKFPPLSLLKLADKVDADAKEEQREKIARLNATFQSFKIDAEVKGVTQGPTVTRYEVYLASGTVKKITSIQDDLAMRLESPNGVIIQAPIPGKNLIGIEVPNKVKQTVSLRSVLQSQEFKNRKSDLTFGLGQDIGGEFITCNIEKMPHLLVAGTTGSGKSVCLNTLLISLIYTTSPEDLRFILIDPKLVEFNMYNGLPHLLLEHVINDIKKAISSFNWAVKEMERRYALFQECRVRDLKAYNELADAHGEAHLPKIVIVVDELADLLIMGKAELEEKIMRIAQKARAAGIHLILATQRPSVDVITGVIKANLPSRIAFKVPDSASSKTILNYGGAENLLGNGDMLYKSVTSSEDLRVQGAFVSTEEVEAVVEYVKRANESDFNDQIEKEITAEPEQIDNEDNDSDTPADSEKELDAYFADALKMGIERNGISLSMIQRRFSVGYARAGKIIDTMEELGYVSEPNGSKPRQILITMDKFRELFHIED